jgi:hypothetical protein
MSDSLSLHNRGATENGFTRAIHNGVGWKLTISVGCLGIALAAFSAATAPATGYELSIYAATPMLFWVGIAVAVGAGIIGTVGLPRHRFRMAAGGLSASGILLVYLLPFIRQYYFFGQADALQHLGWTVGILRGQGLGIDPYPGMHLLAATISYTTGLPARRALLLAIPVVYALVLLVLIPLVRLFAARYRTRAAEIALLSGCLGIPLISVRLPNLQPIATTTGLFYAPFVIWVSLRAMRRDTGFGIVAFVSAVALIFYHPQQAFVVAAVLLAFVVFETVYRRIGGSSQRQSSSQAAIVIIALVTGIALFQWISSRPLFGGALTSLVIGLLNSLSAVETATPGGSLQAVGGSFTEILLKVFLVPVLYGVLAVIGGMTDLRRTIRSRFRDDIDGDYSVDRMPQSVPIPPFLAALASPLLLFGLYTVAGDLAQALRYAAFILLFATPIGAIQLTRTAEGIQSAQAAKVALAVFFIIGVGVTIPSMFRSPYMYQPTSQVTEAQMTGYDWIITHQNQGTPIASVDTDVGRHYHALMGFVAANRRLQAQESGRIASLNNTRGNPALAPAHFADHQLHKRIDNSTYMVTTAWARQQHTQLYDGLVFSSSDFAYLQKKSNINNIYSNGGVNIHLFA